MGQSSVPKNRLRGVVRDQTSAVVPGLSLGSKSEERSGGLTDINGRFEIDLSAGDHVITAGELEDRMFKAFIRITDVGPNPEFVEFLVDSSTLCRIRPEKYDYPRAYLI